MIHTGRIQELQIKRRTREGWVLTDADGHEVLYPHPELPREVDDDKRVRVFVHRDVQGRQVASPRAPKATVGQFAMMRVGLVDRDGAHMEWGVKPDLLVPHAEQRKAMEEGRWYLVRVALDPRSDRIFGSALIEDFLNNDEIGVEEGEAVGLIVLGRSDLGLHVIVNGRHQGLVHANEVFKRVSIGDKLTGHVKHIREDRKLDITLQPIGYRQYNDVNVDLLVRRLRAGNGFLPFTDKSSTEAIYAEFGISKKAFKKAVGALYRERLVRLEDDGIVWVG
ncbi:MAG: GntR family transcriptional regulator [Flavobacteriales bacterium]|nr:GntR family transcriptional regulator [Flavobacteriales bacterium]